MVEKRQMHTGFWVAKMLTEMISSHRMGFGSSITELTRKLVDFPGWGFLECSFPEEEFSVPILPNILSFPLPDDPDEVVNKVDLDPSSFRN